MFDAIQWGTVGQWVGSIGTTLAFTATFYVIRRDANVRRYAQSRKVAFYEDHEGTLPDSSARPTYITVVRNISDEPIYEVEILARGEQDLVEGKRILLPGQAHTLVRYEKFTPDFCIVVFRDNSGKYWQRTLEGILREVGPAFPKPKFMK